jgi:cysteine synthase
VCPSVPFSDPQHYYPAALARSKQPGCVWGNQFEGLANARIHACTTGAEILRQTQGRVAAVALAAGTGGSIAGISQVLKAADPNIQVFLADPAGSSLGSHVRHRTLDIYAPGKSVAEGIGLNRITANFAAARIDHWYTHPPPYI